MLYFDSAQKFAYLFQSKHGETLLLLLGCDSDPQSELVHNRHDEAAGYGSISILSYCSITA